MRRVILFTPFLVLVLLVSAGFTYSLAETHNDPTPSQQEAGASATPQSDEKATPNTTFASSSEAPESVLFTPVSEVYGRVTVKPFGEYFTPELSPVMDEFIGWHTAADIEYTDTEAEVPVFAIADGTVLRAEWAYGYGGVVVIRHAIDGESRLALYGHLDYKMLPDVGAFLRGGEQFAQLGDGHSYETDGSRKHLHFGLPLGQPVDIRGYVQNDSELSGWDDPMSLFPEECTMPGKDLMSPGIVTC